MPAEELRVGAIVVTAKLSDLQRVFDKCPSVRDWSEKNGLADRQPNWANRIAKVVKIDSSDGTVKVRWLPGGKPTQAVADVVGKQIEGLDGVLWGRVVRIALDNTITFHRACLSR